MNRIINLKHWRERCIAAKNYCRNYYKKNTKKVNKIVAIVGVVLAFGIIGTLYSRVDDVRSPRLFDHYLGRAPYSLVMFYEKNPKELQDDKSLRKSIRTLSETFDEVSDRSRYKQAGVEFVKVNVSREKLRNVAQSYGATKFPTCMLFNFGKPIPEATLSGSISGKNLEAFIESHVKKNLDIIIDQKELIHERRLEGARSNAPYWYWGWGSPIYSNWNGRYSGWGYGWSN